jgi:hypothetical protein
MMQTRNLKARILEGVDDLLGITEHEINVFKNRGTALAEHDVRNLREFLDEQHKLIVFRNAFVAEDEVGPNAYSHDVLAEVVSFIIAREA